MDAPESTNILSFLLTGGGAVVITQLLNVVANRKQRTAEPAKMLVEGSVAWAKGLAEAASEAASRAERIEDMYDDLRTEHVALRVKCEGLERRMDRQQYANSKHTHWDEALMAKLREAGIDFPDPPSLEVA